MKESINYTMMIKTFGTDDVKNGKLTGTTDTDYFYFLCPKCNNGGSEIMRILDFGDVEGIEYKYKELVPQPKKAFQISFELYCDRCKTHTVVKISNSNGWQGGSITDERIGMDHKVIGPNEQNIWFKI